MKPSNEDEMPLARIFAEVLRAPLSRVDSRELVQTIRGDAACYYLLKFDGAKAAHAVRFFSRDMDILPTKPELHMRDYIYCGPVPSEEDCAQVGTDDYQYQCFREMRAYKTQIKRVAIAAGIDLETANVEVRSKGSEHEFGTYYEVVLAFDGNNEDAVDAAYALEKLLPTGWDAEARAALGLAERT